MKTRILLGLMAFGAIIAAAFMAIGQAHADPVDLDMQFLAMASRDGITSSGGASDLINGAHEVCRERMAGVSESTIVSEVLQGSKITHISTARAVVYDAEQVYCPGYYVGGAGSTV